MREPTRSSTLVIAVSLAFVLGAGVTGLSLEPEIASKPSPVESWSLRGTITPRGEARPQASGD